jgi:sugar lactone lactonase YvrE
VPASLAQMKRRLSILITAVMMAMSGVAAPASAHGVAPFPSEVALPAGFQPEGIAVGPGHTAYVGSLLNGDIYQANLATGEGRIIARGPGTAAAGVKYDGRGRLFVAGGWQTSARVVDVRTGRTLADYQLATAGTGFVNDVVLTGDAAWFTDSFRPVLYKVPLGRHGQLPEAAVTVPLTGDYQFVPDAWNANGIVRTPDGRGLLIVSMIHKQLFRVDPATGATTLVTMSGADAEFGDGMVLAGRTLYVVQGWHYRVAVFRLDAAATTATFVAHISHERFAVPSTAAKVGGRLYVVSARFDTTPDAATPYWVTAIDR